MELQPGDVFCTRNPMALGRAINAVQKFWSKDNESKYSHAGIIIDPDGTTFEALWTNRRQNIYKAYAGTGVLIARHALMCPERFEAGWAGVEGLEGKWYAGHRLLFFLIPPLAKYLSLGLGVCSELAAKFLHKASLVDEWRGKNPDDVADMIHRWRDWEVVFEGTLVEQRPGYHH